MRIPATDHARFAESLRGFTLIEMIVTILITAILVTIAIPNFRPLLLNNTLTALSNDMLSSLQTARSEAIKRNTQVVLCMTSNVTTPTCAGAGAAVNSWFIFQDTNGNGQYDAGDVLIELHPQIPSGRFLYGDGAQSMVFAPTGFPAVGVAQTHNVLFCDSRGIAAYSYSSTARALQVSTTGHGTVVNSVSQVQAAKTAIGAGAACS
jgi:prepilin-type N-terminal cleavage/methylation domain-containing protein